MVSTLTSMRLFDTVPHNILIGKLRMCGLNEWTMMKPMGSCGTSRRVWPTHSLLSSGEATSGLLRPVLVSRVQEKQGATEEGRAKGHKDDVGSGVSLMRRDQERWICLVWRRAGWEAC